MVDRSAFVDGSWAYTGGHNYSLESLCWCVPFGIDFTFALVFVPGNSRNKKSRENEKFLDLSGNPGLFIFSCFL
jgi:hypothetical protein